MTEAGAQTDVVEGTRDHLMTAEEPLIENQYKIKIYEGQPGVADEGMGPLQDGVRFISHDPKMGWGHAGHSVQCSKK